MFLKNKNIKNYYYIIWIIFNNINIKKFFDYFQNKYILIIKIYNSENIKKL